MYTIIGEHPAEFTNLQETQELCSWLSRLSDTADYKADGEMQKAFAKKIIDYLNQANNNIDFRTTFYEVIQGASETCGDRITLSILHLNIAHQLATIDLKDMKKLADFLIKGPWTIEMLENAAREKIPHLNLFDEIEVYLGYPIQLKKDLEIPIDVQNMLYFTCSALTPRDLEETKNAILNEREDQEKRLKSLINHTTWQKALSVNYPEEYQVIMDKREEASAVENPEYILDGF
ncbi:MAG: NEL-type E3 ubiquitin ligase domain-containing protein [Verrucomicrobiota bacterium]